MYSEYTSVHACFLLVYAEIAVIICLRWGSISPCVVLWAWYSKTQWWRTLMLLTSQQINL